MSTDYNTMQTVNEISKKLHKVPCRTDPFPSVIIEDCGIEFWCASCSLDTVKFH